MMICDNQKKQRKTNGKEKGHSWDMKTGLKKFENGDKVEKYFFQTDNIYMYIYIIYNIYKL